MSRHPNAVPFRIREKRNETPVPSATIPKGKVELRERIEEQVAKFLDNGGTIQRPALQDRTQRKKPTFCANISDAVWG